MNWLIIFVKCISNVGFSVLIFIWLRCIKQIVAQNKCWDYVVKGMYQWRPQHTHLSSKNRLFPQIVAQCAFDRSAAMACHTVKTFFRHWKRIRYVCVSVMCCELFSKKSNFIRINSKNIHKFLQKIVYCIKINWRTILNFWILADDLRFNCN